MNVNEDNYMTSSSNKAQSEKKSFDIQIGSTDTDIFSMDVSNISGMLVGGTTGSGKTSFVQAIIAECMNNLTPDDVKFAIFDSKYVDYSYLNESPYLLIPVCTDEEKVPAMTSWMNAEIRTRLKSEGDYPHLFFIFDDYARVSRLIEEDIIQILQVGRRAKIHIIIVTSTPSADIVSTSIREAEKAKIREEAAIAKEKAKQEALERRRAEREGRLYSSDVDVNNSKRLTDQNAIVGTDYELSVSGNCVIFVKKLPQKLYYHPSATYRIGSDKIVSVNIKKPGLLSGGYLEINLSSDFKMGIDDSEYKKYGLDTEEDLKTFLSFYQDSKLRIPISRIEYTEFKHFYDVLDEDLKK